MNVLVVNVLSQISFFVIFFSKLRNILVKDPSYRGVFCIFNFIKRFLQ